MAEPAAPAPATAPDPSASTEVTPAVSPTRAPMVRPDLDSRSSFDVEELLRGEAPGTATETDPEDEALDDSAQPDAENVEEVETEEDADESEAAEAVKPKTVRRLQAVLKQRDAAKAELRAKAAEIEALTEKLSKVDDKPVVMQGDNDPLAAATTYEQLEAAESNAKAWRRWCRSNPLGGTPPGKDAEEMDSEQITATLEWAEHVIDNVPKRHAFLTKFHETRAKVKTEMPAMFKAGSPEQKRHSELQRQLLNFRTAAEQDSIIAKIIFAETVEREKREGIANYPRVALKKGATPEPKPTPKTFIPQAPMPRVKSLSPTTGDVWERSKTQAVDVEEMLAGR